jgi:homoserine kinase
MVEAPFTIHVPATTANLGPGFDCLGLALDLWNTITFSQERHHLPISINGIGKGSLPENESNLILKSASQLAHAHGLSLPKEVHIHCQNNIPIASGLGSSASAVVGGLIGARKLLDLKISDHELLQTAAQIEGHADNAAACLFGGLILVGSDEDHISVTHLEMPPLTAVVAIPEFSLSTDAARKALSTIVQLNDAVFNISQAIRMVQILEKGNFEDLKSAMQDRLHQVYRLPLLPGSEIVMQAAINAGAYGTCLSGAGPGVIAFSDQANAQAISNSMQSAYLKAALPSNTLVMTCPSKGYFIT